MSERKDHLWKVAQEAEERIDEISLIHADAIISDDELALILIERDCDAESGIVTDQLGFCDALIAELLASIGGIGDQLAQENIAV